MLWLDRSFSTEVVTGAALTGGFTLVGIALGKWIQRGGDRHRRIARQVHDIAATRGWSVEKRMKDWEQGWSTSPLANLKNVTVSPGALGARGAVLLGVAYLEGDSALASADIRTFSSRLAIAELGVPLPSMTLLAQGHKDELAKLLGGRDLDVESVEFNKAWRVLTDDPRGAHGVLNPRVIEYLTGAPQKGVAIQCDGTRLVVWDDGSRASVDLSARVDFLEGLVDRLAGFLKSTS